MDKLAEFIIAVMIAILIIIAMIYVLVYAVAPALIFYFLGRQFYRQIQKSVLGIGAKMTLVGIGVVSILMAIAIVNEAGIGALMIAPLSPLIFLLLAIPTIAIWMYNKKKHFIDEGYRLESEKSETERQIKANNRAIEQVQNKIGEIKTRFNETLRRKENLEDDIRELCKTDPRTYTILKREWEATYTRMTDKALDEQKREYISTLKRGGGNNTVKKTEYAIRLCLIRAEEIKRVTLKPLTIVKTETEKLQEIERRRIQLNERMNNITEQINRNESAYKAFLNTKIVLD